MAASTVMVVPTYNERENIELLLDGLLGFDIPGLSILVVDDQSPDGTAEIAAKFREKDARVHVLVREGPRGRGVAGIDGFRHALAMGADWVGEMDGDLSHRPEDLPSLLAACEEADIVVGSRYVEGGKVIGWGWYRHVNSRLSNAMARWLLGIHLRDTTSGYRLFHRRVLEGVPWDQFISTGPTIVEELLVYTLAPDVRTVEVPITFVDRVRGNSKLDLTLLFKCFWTLLGIRARKART